MKRNSTHPAWIALMLAAALATCGCSRGSANKGGGEAADKTEETTSQVVEEPVKAGDDGLPVPVVFEVYDYEGNERIYSYGAPSATSNPMPSAALAFISDEELLFEYGYIQRDDGHEGDWNVFDEFPDRVIARSGNSFRYISSAESLTTNASANVTVNGRDMLRVEGSFECGEASVPFVAYVFVDGDISVWCLVDDDSADQSVSADVLASWAERVASSFSVREQ